MNLTLLDVVFAAGYVTGCILLGLIVLVCLAHFYEIWKDNRGPHERKK